MLAGIMEVGSKYMEDIEWGKVDLDYINSNYSAVCKCMTLLHVVF